MFRTAICRNFNFTLAAAFLFWVPLTLMGQGLPQRPSPFIHLDPAAIRVRFYLEMTPDQFNKFEELQQAQAQQRIPVAQELNAVEQQLTEQFKLENPSLSTIGQLVLQARTLRLEQLEMTKSQVEQLRSILTPEQVGRVDAAAECLRLGGIPELLVQTGFVARPSFSGYVVPIVP